MGPNLAESSAQGRLTLTEECEAVMSELMDSYAVLGGACKPLVNINRLRTQFEQAGRRPRQMAPLSEVRTFTLMLVSRSTDIGHSH